MTDYTISAYDYTNGQYNIPDELSLSNEEKELMNKHLLELRSKLSGVNSESDDNIKTSLYNFVKERMEMSSFVSELHNDEYKNEFETDQNRLITLLAKNKNIYDKLSTSKFHFYILLGVLAFYIIGLIFMYTQGELIGNELQSTVLISISLFVLLFFVAYDIYKIATRKHYEGFNAQPSNAQLDQIQEMIDEYVELLPYLVKLENKVLHTERNTQKKEIIRSILHDFNNQNYVNMRQYQLTDYKINETRNNMHFIKYAFLLFSVIGILGGLQLRTDLKIENNQIPISQGFFITSSIILMATYLFVFLLHQKQNKMRKKYNWNKLYWNLKATNGESDYI